MALTTLLEREKFRNIRDGKVRDRAAFRDIAAWVHKVAADVILVPSQPLEYKQDETT